MNKEHEIVRQIQTAQKDTTVANSFIQQYLPFIKAETAKFTKRIPMEGQDDELSIAMFAFYEAMMAYKSGKGAFLKLASMAIRNRLIDYYRKEQRHADIISYDRPIDTEENATAILDNIASDKDEIQELTHRAATREEILEFSEQLATFGLSLTDIADNCPKQDRTLSACLEVLAYARTQPDLLEQMVGSKRLPITQLAKASGIPLKTLERHRKYLIAILLAYTNGFEIIRGHLYQLGKKEVQ